MIIATYILIFLSGFLLLRNVSPNFTRLEYIAFTFPIGFGIWSYTLTFLEILGIKINQPILLCAVMLIWLILLMLRLHLKRKIKLASIKSSVIQLFSKARSNIKQAFGNPIKFNPAYAILLLLTCGILISLTIKSIYWPVVSYDTINGYDLLAKVISYEGALSNSVFDATNPLHSARSFYPPLLVHALSISYIFGIASSKLISVLFMFSVVFGLYGLLRLRNTHFRAIISVFILCITTEYIAFNAISTNNTVCAFYVLVGMASFQKWYRENDNAYFILSCITLNLAIWSRLESIVFAFILGLYLLLKVYKSKQYIKLFIFSSSTLFPFLLWQVFMKYYIPAESFQPILTSITIDTTKISAMMSKVNAVLFSTSYYGYTIYILMLVWVGNAICAIKIKHLRMPTFSLALCFLLFLFTYYQIDTDYTTETTGWISAGFKRGLFYFIPIGCYFIGDSYIMKKLL